MLDPVVPCLDDATVLHLVSGVLAPGDLARIDAHLDQCGDCRALVAMVARGSGSGDPGDAAAIGALRPGAVVGRYVVGDMLGGGAMGVVHAAWDPELGRRVALKLLHPDEGLDAGAARDRLLREAQAMARLQHPNVASVYEVGTVGDRVFLAMELVAGTTLRAWMRPGRPWAEVCDVMVQAGRGLAAAHAAGVVHRDVKPDNILVGDDGRVRVGDFGLARAAGPAGAATSGAPGGAGIEGAENAEPRPTLPALIEGAENAEPRPTSFTRRAAVAGTPAYMAPEALRGGAAGARCDVFGFCVTFFEALHGAWPFAGGTVAEMLEAIALGRTAPPKRGVPAWLMAIVRRGLSARPEDRFPSMAALLDALAVIEAKRRARGRRWGIAAVTGVAAVTAAAAVLALARPEPAGPRCDGGAARVAAVWSEASRGRVAAALEAHGGGGAGHAVAALDRWAAAWAAAHDATCRATHERGEQSALLLDLRMRCLERRRGEAAALVERLGRADAEAARRAVDAATALPEPLECRDLDAAGVDPLPRDPALAAAADEALAGLADARAALLVGDHRKALTRARALGEAAARSGHAPTRAEVELVRAEALRLGGDGPGAEEAAQASLWAAERGHDDVAAAHAWLALLALAGERRDLAAAEERARHAEAALGRAGDPPALVARLGHARGLVAYNRGHLDEAERHLIAALQKRRALHGDDDLAVARSRSALGSVARARGRLDEARQHHEAALAVDRRRLGDDHPDVARDEHNLGGVARLAGDLDAALAHYERALAIRRAALGDDHVDTALTRNSVGLVLLERGRLDDAERELAAALAIFAHVGHGDRAIAQHNLGLLAQRRGDHAAALRWFAEAEAGYRATLGAGAEASERLGEDRAASERALAEGAARRAAGARPARPAQAPPARQPPARQPPAGVYGASQPWDRP
ncbi:MAG TPA: serine/threonine-protein kinase [Bacilli bacterium]|nr:serine/threonine-protein kinase [Bacilli bacterium]